MNPEVKRAPKNRLLTDLAQPDGLRAKSYRRAQGKNNRQKTMKPSIDFKESLKDSPRFRANIDENEQSIYDLESHLEKVTKACTSFVDNGKLFKSSMGNLVQEFQGITTLFKDDVFVQGALNKMCSNLSEVKNFLGILLDQAQRSIGSKLHAFLKDEIKKVKETKKHFDKISDERDSVLIKNSQLLRTCKVSESEEVENLLTATDSAFNHTSLDYAFQINVLQSKRRFHILGQLLTFMHAQSAFFKQGGELMTCLAPYLKDMGSKLDHMQYEFNCDLKEMEERHTLVQRKNDVNSDSNSFPRGNCVLMEGYLFKRASNAFKTWNRRWFSIQDNKIYYQKRSKDSQTELVDVRLCTVKKADDLERRFTFSFVSPTKCWYLQADSDELRQKWIAIVQVAIAKALNDPGINDDLGMDKSVDSLERLHPQYLLEQIRSLPGNDICADCNSPNPKWASINIGITLCIECSGIHRSLGVHISKVRSITLDDWEPESIKLMTELGNRLVNDVYEAKDDVSMVKPDISSTRAEREPWIRAKYVEKRFVSKIRPRRGSAANKRLRRQKPVKKFEDGVIRKWSFQKDESDGLEILNRLSQEIGHESNSDGPKSPSLIQRKSYLEEGNDSETSSDECGETEEEMKSLPPNQLLFQASKLRNLSLMILALANGADPNWPNPDHAGMTALHQSVAGGHVIVSEFLLQNGAKVTVKDQRGRSPLHQAAILGSTGHACLLLKRGANQKSCDENGEDPLRIALKYYHADIVTLLRLARMNEEMRETEVSTSPDETFSNVIKDFSNMASQNPEKLKRSTERHTSV